MGPQISKCTSSNAFVARVALSKSFLHVLPTKQGLHIGRSTFASGLKSPSRANLVILSHAMCPSLACQRTGLILLLELATKE